MATIIEAPDKWEIRSVIRFLQVEDNTAAEIHRKFCVCVREKHRER